MLMRMSITFKVSDMATDGGTLLSQSIAEVIKSTVKGKIEASFDLPGGVVKTQEHALLGAARLAFAEHLPLVLRPDDIWLTIVQGFAQHVQLDTKGLRSRLVEHSDEVNLVVIRDEFSRGNRANDWAGVFPEFGMQIKEHVGKRHDLIIGDFSTTGSLERVVANLALMDVMQSFFTYTVLTRCGIPEITLKGTVDDWRNIRDRVRALAEFDLEWWTSALEPIWDQIIVTAEGNPDRQFWRSFYKWNDHSGGPFVSGWINTLFPYTKPDNEVPVTRNPFAIEWDKAQYGGGPRSEDFLQGIRSVPFTWDYIGTKLSMRFHGGFVGVRQDPQTLELSPQLGWAVEDLNE